ncbi:MAG: sigma-54 interaction domain-containing protein [Spirochaetia bacterium]
MRNLEVLCSFVGDHDPYCGKNGDEEGPVLSLLQNRHFDRVYLFYTKGYIDKAKGVQEAAQSQLTGTSVNLVFFDIESPIDYQEIYNTLQHTIYDQVLPRLDSRNASLSFLLDPGTPQMQTCLVYLAQNMEAEPTLLQGVPPRFAGGTYKVKEITFPIAKSGTTNSVSNDDENTWDAAVAAQNSILGTSTKLQSVLEQARRFAKYEESLLITGETGTGKELIARFIHENSPRKNRIFYPVNCAAFNRELIGSELFGHQKGAYTGASGERKGYFKSAETGTIFLDEIGDLPLDVQAKLLRVLEEKKIRKLGSDTEEDVDVRVLAATNKDLEKMCSQGSFRQDLYQRISALKVNLPPLRERGKDIMEIIESELDKWNKKYKSHKRFSSSSLEMCLEYPWPGNVRELKNAVTQSCAQSIGDEILPSSLPPTIQNHFHIQSPAAKTDFTIPEDGVNLKALLYNIEKKYYEKALEKYPDNLADAARSLSIEPHAFRKALKERFGDLLD